MWNSKHILLTVVVPVALLGGGIAVEIWPTYRHAQELRGEVTSLERKVEGLEGATDEVERLASQVASVQQQINGDLKIIPDQADIASIIRRLSLPVDGNTVVDQTFTTGASNPAVPNEADSTVEMTPLTVDMQANFDSVFALVRAVESMDRLIRVSSVRIECDREKDQRDYDGNPLVKATVGLEAIYHKAEGSDADSGAWGSQKTGAP